MTSERKGSEAAIAQAIARLLDGDLDITARAVAKLLGVAPSTITRSPFRSKLVADAADQQRSIRAIAAANKSSTEALVARIAKRDEEIASLQRRINILVASHRAMLLAVGEMGGMDYWQKFFAKYDNIRQALRSLDAMPEPERPVPPTVQHPAKHARNT